ncbi:MAG TPA: BON domain-containing protein [Pseudomonadales bacterium]|nr:BON domain-containing protein [Pseudomonadales bacterium]
MKNKNRILSVALCLGLLTTGAVGSFTGCAGNANERSTGQYIDDKTMQHQVRDALSDNAEYKFDNVNVDVYRGQVQLSGFVQNSDQKSKAKDIAKSVQGVKDVENNISIQSSNQ